jgi:hypothetical protein
MEETIEESLQLIHRHVGRAVDAVAGDAGASPVLRAVLAEFARKAETARAGGEARDPHVRDLILEVEQAGDSAKAAAQADAGLSAGARELVVAAHDAFCLLKGRL